MTNLCKCGNTKPKGISQCKECKSKYDTIRYKKNDKKIKKRSKKYYSSHKKEKLEYIKINEEKIKAYKHNFYLKNKDNILEERKEYYESHKDEILSKQKEYYNKHKQQISEKRKSRRKNNLEQIRKRDRDYGRDNSNIIKMKNRKRRAKKSNVNENFTYEDELFIIQLFDNKCFNCNSSKDLTIDHIYPLSKGHALTIKNACILCRSCNSSKKDNDPKLFFGEETFKKLMAKIN